jgi:phytoene desaturase
MQVQLCQLFRLFACTMKIQVIGSGIAGLAASVRLACAGHEVEVFEANSYPGGKLSEQVANGYRFDAGPSLFTLPALVDELFMLAGKDPRKHFNYIRLERSCMYFYEDGTRFTAYHNREKFAEEAGRVFNAEDKPAIKAYLDQSAFQYQIASPVFLRSALHRFRSYLNIQTLRGLLNMFRLNIFSTMHGVNERSFRDKRLVQYFDRFATYNGSDPYRASGILTMIPHLEHTVGTFFPEKGMHDITRSIYDLAKELGVVFHMNSPVEKICTRKEGKRKHVSGVMSSNRLYPSDCVVCNADIVSAYRKLLPEEKAPEKILSQEKSSSALIFYWNIRNSFPELDLHNIFFSASYEEEFDHIFRQRTVYHDPTVYLNITSKYKKDDAPEGSENWFVMINVPHNSGQDWDAVIRTSRAAVLAKLSRLLKKDIEPLIEGEQVLDPRSIESKTSSSQGALYGNASNSRYAAFLRHSNASADISGLYFCGGSVHPGGGIPLCLYSAEIVAGLVREDYG